MLIINIEAREFWDESNQCFVTIKPVTVYMEHSLISISKWESKWKKAFLDPKLEKNKEELYDYFSCMTVRPSEIPWTTFLSLTAKQVNEIMTYINDYKGATTIRKVPGKGHNRNIITSELIYYWMVAAQIPFECEKWHLSRLLKLIEIYGIKNDTKGNKKMKRNEIINQNDALNDIRRAQLKTKG